MNGVYLGRDRLLVSTNWGGKLVVPAFNIDVALGVIRDGVIEPWTTRLVQELLGEGQHYLNAGGNFGYYMVLGGHRVGASGSVKVIEPNPYIVPYLLMNLFYGGIPDRTHVYKCALGNTTGETITFAFDPQFLGGGGASRESGQTFVDGSFEDACWSAESISQLFDENDRFILGKGLMLHFETKTRTIDAICDSGPPLDLIHLDIEGAEPLALAGARDTISRSPNLRLITEWCADHFAQASQTSQEAFRSFWHQVTDLGFRPRQLLPKIEPDGGIRVSSPLDFAYMTESAPHSDYVWVKASHDPWGK
ncbi:FkbM family methyltransferase [Bradyrhizobium cenepequi]